MTSEAPFPPNLQNWTKSISFHDSGLSEQLSFGWASWKPLRLNYSSNELPNSFFLTLIKKLGAIKRVHNCKTSMDDEIKNGIKEQIVLLKMKILRAVQQT